MKLKLLPVLLVVAIAGLSNGCTMSEVGQKTKSGFKKTGSYISEKSKKGYRGTKKALGLESNSTTDNAPESGSKTNSSTKK